MPSPCPHTSGTHGPEVQRTIRRPDPQAYFVAPTVLSIEPHPQPRDEDAEVEFDPCQSPPAAASASVGFVNCFGQTSTGGSDRKREFAAKGSKASRSGADLLNCDLEWWSTAPEQFQTQSHNPSDKGANILTAKKEWWNMSVKDVGRVNGRHPEAAPEIVEGGWWGDHPQLNQVSGPRTRRCQHGCLGPLRRLASRGRHRYRIHGFDLDLTYITSRIVAMGFPAAGSRKMYRNPRSEVARFLNFKHPDHFRIYNLCIEENYRYNGFPEHTFDFPCPDHCPLALPLMLKFCRNAAEWLQAEKDNVAVVHCKAGKGRSGTMICALLVYAGAVPSAYDALRWFAMARGGKRQGVTIPSQIRYLAMFERWLRHGTEDLSSDPMLSIAAPMSDAKPVAQHTRHRLVAVRVGPVHERTLTRAFMTPDSAGEGPPKLMANVRVGLSNREVCGTKEKVLHWYPEQTVVASSENVLQISFSADDGPIWDEPDGDGVIIVLISKAESTMGGKRATVSASAWWHHAFLQKRPATDEVPPTLWLDLPKPCIDTLARDMQWNSIAPFNFHLSALFEDLRDVDQANERREAAAPDQSSV